MRLACVKRAASVDSEPGSNSHLKFRPQVSPRTNSLRHIRSGFTQSSDVLLYCIQPDCQRSAHVHSDINEMPKPTAGLETFFSGTHPTRGKPADQFELEKEPNRKAVFRFDRWPERSFVTIPCKGPRNFYTPATMRSQLAPQGVRFLRSPFPATRPE